MSRFKVGDIVVQKGNSILYNFDQTAKRSIRIPCIIVDTDERFDDSFYIRPLWGSVFECLVHGGKLNDVIDHHNNCFFITDDSIIEIWRANE